MESFEKWQMETLEEMAPYLIGRLEDPQRSVRASAVKIFGRLPTPIDVAPKLRLRLEDINLDVRVEAVIVVDMLDRLVKTKCIDQTLSSSLQRKGPKRRFLQLNVGK